MARAGGGGGGDGGRKGARGGVGWRVGGTLVSNETWGGANSQELREENINPIEYLVVIVSWRKKRKLNSSRDMFGIFGFFFSSISIHFNKWGESGILICILSHKALVFI
jgi:hypothetical protein